MPVTLEFLGAAGAVTGSKFLLEVARRRVLVDCGLYQGLKELRQRNWQPLPVEPRSIDHVSRPRSLARSMPCRGPC